VTIAVNQVVSNSDVGSADTITVDISNTQAGAALEVRVGHISNNFVDSVTDTQGNTYVQATDHPVADGTLFWALDAWVAENIVGGVGANTITVQMGFAQSNRSVHAKEIRGGVTSGLVLAAAAQDESAPTLVTDALTSGTASVGEQPALISGFSTELTGGGNTPAAGTGFASDATATATFAAAWPWRSTSKRITLTGNEAATFTAVSNSRHLTSMVAYKELVTPSGAVKRAMLMGVG
jgi:hypothetical protein